MRLFSQNTFKIVNEGAISWSVLIRYVLNLYISTLLLHKLLLDYQEHNIKGILKKQRVTTSF